MAARSLSQQTEWIARVTSSSAKRWITISSTHSPRPDHTDRRLYLDDHSRAMTIAARGLERDAAVARAMARACPVLLAGENGHAKSECEHKRGRPCGADSLTEAR